MFSPATFEDSPSAISSQESVDGPSPFGLPDGATIDLFGLAPARANLSPRQARELGLLTSGTYGRPGTTSSRHAALRISWASRLQHRLDKTGFPSSTRTWTESATTSGLPLYRLAVSVRFTDVTASGLLPTPSGTSNYGKNHVAGRLDEWGGSSNPFRGTPIGKAHSPAFELWMMGYPATWRQLMPPAMQSCPRSRRK
jgi:hypothetical protein